MATDGIERPSVALNDTLYKVRQRARRAGTTFTQDLTHLAIRYDTLLRWHAPELPSEQLSLFRRMIAERGERLSLELSRPRLLAALVEEWAQPGRQDEPALRATYALARAIARMTPSETLALVEATQRWVRRHDSVQHDPLVVDFFDAGQ